MFEVQLGAGLLLQFRTPDNSVVRVLADAGVGRDRRYKPDHVHKKLNDAFDAFDEPSRRIDLIVGTHYDADHLDGLVPIIEDRNIEITEAWLPPVANDTEPPLSAGPPRHEELLAHQFAGEFSEERLGAYLGNKLVICNALEYLDRLAADLGSGSPNRVDEMERTSDNASQFAEPDNFISDSRRRLETHRAEAARRLKEEGEGHANDDMFVPGQSEPRAFAGLNWLTFGLGVLLLGFPWIFHFTSVLRESLNAWICGVAISGLVLFGITTRSSWTYWLNQSLGLWLVASSLFFAPIPRWSQFLVGFCIFVFAAVQARSHYRSRRLQPSVDLDLGRSSARFLDRWISNPTLIDSDVRTLAFIRKSTANEGINAASLADVVRALRTRRIPIACQTVRDGVPRRFVWSRSEDRFIEGPRLTTPDPELLLLGPSVGLVRKHWHRLPIGRYMALATFDRVPVQSIKPSNELSYVIRMQVANQGILVTGDAGCVDFKPKGKAKFYKPLLNALLPLHVIQVAHHAGRNAEFYNVLAESGYASQRDRSWLLLSHATEDRHRPSDVFNSFIGQVRNDSDQIRLLFTSRPSRDKVREYTSLIHPHTYGPADEGDVRLSFDRVWSVDKHSIQV